MDTIQFTADESIYNESARFHITKNDIHLWWIDERYTHGQSQQRLLQFLSNDEIKRANRYMNQEIRNRFIFFRGTLRIILSKYINSTADKIKFRYLRFGKPELDNQHPLFQQNGLQFNMSHSGHKAVVGINPGRKIGVDLEQEKPMQHMDVIARNYFSALEYKNYDELEGNKRQQAFYTCWTRKEAYLKATGRGFDIPMNKFSVSPLPDESRLLIENEVYPKDINRWELIQISPEPDMTTAIVFQAN